MAIYKCKMCGGDLNVEGDVNVIGCEYCGTTQTVPAADNEKKVNLFNRANRLRMSNEFDKAAGIYENIVVDFPEEAEAYWGLCLCKYGIEYVDDPASAKKIPTCHRSSFESIMDDSDFDQVMEYADAVSRKVYREEARTIEELRKGIIEVSANEKPYDIFICYKETDENGDRTLDSVIAQDVYDELIAKGYRVFFSRVSLEDKLGVEYEPYIFAALNSAKIMLAFGTDYEYFNAVWVKNEWSRYLKLMASDKTRHLVPCFKGIDAYDMPKEFAKLQAQDMGKVGAIQDLLRGIEKILPRNTKPVAETVVMHQSSANPSAESYLKRAFIFLEDGDFKAADEYCEKVLDIDPECAEAYLGKMLCVLKFRKEEELGSMKKTFDSTKYFEKVIRYANNDLRNRIYGYLQNITDRIEREHKKLLAEQYTEALGIFKSAKNEDDFRDAASKFNEILNYKDSEELYKLCLSNAEKKLKELIAALEKKRKEIKPFSDIIASGAWHSTALKTDGTLISTFDVEFDCDDICSVASTQEDNIVLTSNGTVYCDEEYDDEDEKTLDFSGWTDIVSIGAGLFHVVGLKKDGTVVVTGESEDDQSDVLNWENIVSISAGCDFSAGLTKNGTVEVSDKEIFSNCEKWNDIVAISCGAKHILGLKADGTVLAIGDNDNGQCNVSHWKNIVSVSAGCDFSVGLTLDGTVVATNYTGEQFFNEGQCNVADWRDIVAICTGCGSRFTLGVKTDGTVLATGRNDDGQCNVKDWKLFNVFSNYEEERKIATQKRKYIIAEEQQKRRQEEAELQRVQTERRSKSVCQYCGGSFKGLFTKKCSVCGKEKDY